MAGSGIGVGDSLPVRYACLERPTIDAPMIPLTALSLGYTVLQ
jgi:hypothetical protein